MKIKTTNREYNLHIKSYLHNFKIWFWIKALMFLDNLSRKIRDKYGIGLDSDCVEDKKWMDMVMEEIKEQEDKYHYRISER